MQFFLASLVRRLSNSDLSECVLFLAGASVPSLPVYPIRTWAKREHPHVSKNLGFFVALAVQIPDRPDPIKQSRLNIRLGTEHGRAALEETTESSTSFFLNTSRKHKFKIKKM